MKRPRVPKVPGSIRGEYERPAGESLIDRAGRKSHRVGAAPPEDAKPIRGARRARREAEQAGQKGRQASRSGRRSPSHPQGWEYDRTMKSDRPRAAIDSDPDLYAPQGRHHRRGTPGKHRTPYEGRHRK